MSMNDPDKYREREALSRRYLTCAIVVPLNDGSFAVFASDRTSESMVIVDDTEHLSLAITSRANMIDRKTPSKGAEVDMSSLFADED